MARPVVTFIITFILIGAPQVIESKDVIDQRPAGAITNKYCHDLAIASGYRRGWVVKGVCRVSK